MSSPLASSSPQSMSVSEKRLSVRLSEIEPQKRPRSEPPCNKESRPILDLEEVRGKGTFVWQPYDSSDDEDEGDGDVHYIFKGNFDSRREALREEKAIRRRLRGKLPEEKQKTTAEAEEQTRKGRWFCVVKDPGDPVHCLVCLKDHPLNICPYLNYVPKGAELGPKAMLVCKCCNQEDGHGNRDDWVGVAAYITCFKCFANYDHRTKDCPLGNYNICWYCRRKSEQLSCDCPKN
ncbi:uncharacterized protein LOC110769081 isoform X1 [Prunus avium]|uniref:Uncharacterized protein LOC110769081 isoform X1 n=2 Tax=Prunus avium TaxID=42229 RepID=A0A6P5TNT1_PRUAV|nr:uncharacterized protein LOC110769081 isoform X1 [Prunus avium]